MIAWKNKITPDGEPWKNDEEFDNDYDDVADMWYNN